MSLRSVLITAEFTPLADSEALTLLLTDGVELSRDETAYTWSGVNQRLGEMGLPFEILAGWDTVMAALPGGSMMGRMLDSGGVNFTLPNVRAGLLAVLAAQPDEPVPTVIQSLLNIGIKYGFRWQAESLTDAPTLESIVATRATIADESVRQFISDRAQSALNAVESGDVLTTEQAREWLGAPL